MSKIIWRRKGLEEVQHPGPVGRASQAQRRVSWVKGLPTLSGEVTLPMQWELFPHVLGGDLSGVCRKCPPRSN